MEGKEAVAGSQEEGPKKRIPLESLSKEELIKKYKNLIVIAQKAKEAKDEASEEMKWMKEKLNALQENSNKPFQKNGNDLLKENQLEKQIGAMQEMISNLTDQKLQFAMEMDAIKKKTVKLEEELSHMKVKENKLKCRVGELEIERDGFERQARRLEKEAESLTLALDETERQGSEVLLAAKAEKEQLQKELESVISKGDSSPESSSGMETSLKKQLEVEEGKYSSLQKEVNLFITLIKGDTQVSQAESSLKTLKSAWNAFSDIQQHYAMTKEEINRLKKIEEEKNAAVAEIEQLKELANAGACARNQLQELNEDREVLVSQIHSLKAALAVYNECKEKLIAVEKEKEVLATKVAEMENENELKKELQKRLVEAEDERDSLRSHLLNFNELKEQLNALQKEKMVLVERVSELQQNVSDAKVYEEKLALALSENSSLLNDISTIKEAFSSCQDELCKLKSQREELDDKISKLEAECDKVKDHLKEVLEENEKLHSKVKDCEKIIEESKVYEDKYLETLGEKEMLEKKIESLHSSISKDDAEKEQILKITSERDDCLIQVKKLQEEIENQKEAKEKLNAAEAEKAALKFRVEELETSQEDFKSQLSIIQKEVEDLNGQLITLQDAMEKHSIYKDSAEAEKEALKLENESLKESNNLVKEEKEKLEKEVHSLKMKLEKKSSCEERLTVIESDRQAVIAELERLRLMLSESEGARDDLRTQNERLKGMLANLEERLRAAEEGAEGVREALENKVNSLQSALREKEALESELSALRETLARVEELMKEMEDAKNVTEGENRSLRESLKEQNKVVERLQEVEEGKDGMEREIEALRTSLKEESSTKEKLEAEKQALEKEVNTLRTTVKDEDKIMERLREVEEEKDAMEREIEALRITLKDESKLREALRTEKEVKEALEKELEALKVTLTAEAKVRENLRLAVERSSMLEREVEDLKLTLKEESKVREELREVLTQKNMLEKEVQSLTALRVDVSRFEFSMKKMSEEKDRILEMQKELMNQNELSRRSLQIVEEEKASLQLSIQEIERLFEKWEELMKHLSGTNALEKILMLADGNGGKSSEENGNSSENAKRNLAKEIENFSSIFKSNANESHFRHKVHNLLQAVLVEFNQINVKSEDVADRFKKLVDEKCKVKKDLEKKLLKLRSQNEESRKKRESENVTMLKEVDAIREAVGLKPCTDNAENLSEVLQEIVNVKQKLKELIEEKERLEEAVSCKENGIKATKEAVVELEKKVEELEAAKVNAEEQLISEMKGVNAVLKKRGEAIESLEAEIGKLSCQLLEEQKARREAISANQEVAVKECPSNQSSRPPQMKASDKRVEELEEECKSLKLRISDLEKQGNLQNARGAGACDGVSSEVLSTSTISKVEEMSRLKDVEESFEDRYTKLRTVAVKLKRRCTELEGERKRADELQGRVNSLTKELSNLSLQAKNAQSLQFECDRLQDKVDELGKEINLSKKALKESVDECAAYKIQVQEYKGERNHVTSSFENVTKEKAALEAGLREANIRVQSLRKEADSEASQRKHAEKEVHRLEQELSSAKGRISQEEARCADALKQLEQGKQTWKRGNVLSLEMDALEQSAADLRRQLEESREEARKLKESLSLAETELEKSKQKEEEAQMNKELLKETKEKLFETEKLKNEADGNVERLRREVETQSLQLVKLMAEAKRQTDSYRTQQEAVLAQASVLENQVTRLRTDLIEKNTELEQLRSDFSSYKVRAQAVLLRKEQEREAEGGVASRRDKEEEEAKQQEWDRERQQLERAADGLRRTLEDVTSQLEELRAERESMEEKCNSLDAECHRLRDVSRQTEEQHREEARQARLQSDTLIRSYKQQLEDFQERYRSETLSLKEQLQKLKDEKEQAAVQQSAAETLKRNRSSDEHGSRASNAHAVPWALATEGTLAPLDGRSATEMALHPREEGEGSESVDSPPSPHSSAYVSHGHGKAGAVGRRKKKGLLPLDQLLSSSSLPDEEETDNADHDTLQGDEEETSVGDWVSGRRSSSGMVAALERRSKHLSLLLSEAESEGARLAQQNALLKEEVRRLERSAERTEHAQNAEYLKNVLIKFITLQGGDERCRLVPVLTTILRLSPEETAQLNTVASGGVLDSSHGAGAARGWGSYLHLWPSSP